MKQPKVYIKSLDRVFEVESIMFETKLVELYDKDRSTYFYHDFDEVEFIYDTGINDKNGKEIESGDILKTEFAGILHIKFHNVYGFYAVKKDDKYWFSEEIEDEDNETLSKTEVIGNIYENKELLKC